MTDTIEHTMSSLGNPTGRRPRRHARALAGHLVATTRFTDCSIGELTALVRAGTVLSVPAQWAFLREGAPADAVYLVITGHAEVFRHGRAIAAIGPGDIVGEIALLHGGQRTATVTSTDALKVLRVEYTKLAAVLARHGGLRRVIAGIGAERVGTAA